MIKIQLSLYLYSITLTVLIIFNSQNDWANILFNLFFIHLLVINFFIAILYLKTRLHITFLIGVLSVFIIIEKLNQFDGLYNLAPAKTNYKLSMMTYNVDYKNKHFSEVLKYIKNNDVDIITLQELRPKSEPWLLKDLRKHYPYHDIQIKGNMNSLGIFSKYPLRPVSETLAQSSRMIAQTVEVQVGTKEVHLTNVHLSSPARALHKPLHFFSIYKERYELRLKQWQKIKANVLKNDNKDQISILAGDFNSMDSEGIYRKIRKDFADSHHCLKSGYGFTFPNTRYFRVALVRIDYFFLRGPVRVMRSYPLFIGGSDHLPLLTEIQF